MIKFRFAYSGQTVLKYEEAIKLAKEMTAINPNRPVRANLIGNVFGLYVLSKETDSLDSVRQYTYQLQRQMK